MTKTAKRDLSARWLPFLVIWALPLALLFSLDFASGFLGPHAQTGAAAALLAWMGSACTINALRCRRLHCLITGPGFLLGAALLALVALDIISFGRQGPTYIIWGTLAVAALSFLPERLFGKYLEPRS